jgi:hypothetical protein
MKSLDRLHQIGLVEPPSLASEHGSSYPINPEIQGMEDVDVIYGR